MGGIADPRPPTPRLLSRASLLQEFWVKPIMRALCLQMFANWGAAPPPTPHCILFRTYHASVVFASGRGLPQTPHLLSRAILHQAFFQTHHASIMFPKES